jgi:3-methylcrotonyl-CoA carboxylase alpha subunit
MNTRLQVEHPVTEMITGQDLVEWQLRVAAGERLPLAQAQLEIRGHAIEARIYAEDADKGFLPSTGRLVHLAPPPESLNVRVDTGVETGDEISPHYDPMIAKLIVWDANRDAALARMRKALADYRVVGVTTNIDFLGRLVACPAFAGADLDTGLIERQREFLFPERGEPPRVAFFVAAVAELLREQRETQASAARSADPWSPWNDRDGWRMNLVGRRSITFRPGRGDEDRQYEIAVAYAGDGWRLTLAGETVTARGQALEHDQFAIELDDRRLVAGVIAVTEKSEARRHIFLNGLSYQLVRHDPLHLVEAGGAHGGGLTAPMPGKVVALLAPLGQRVDKGAPLLILEAMKMEHTITAPQAGVVQGFRYGVGDQVSDGAELLDFTVAAA